MKFLPKRSLPTVVTLLAVTALSGCAATEAKDACGAEGYQSLVGTSLAAVTLPASLNSRIIQPGDLVTQDYAEDRINFELDDKGTITRVFCG
ncbi:I78 family peptidase inhibitor [Denitrobaculum tricleocarpae]|nr:I78 family peptidase inhibitor [Denitrobaculum tricleocarpae]